MREIEFRGKTISGEWVYGLLSIVSKEYSTKSRPEGYYISNTAGAPFAFHVRPETVGQYCGIKDYRGTKIYEHDIIDHIGMRLDVRIESFHGYRVMFGKDTMYRAVADNGKVVGNIFDNPEMMLLNKDRT